ncbi:MAG: hypothetical protein JW820_13150 [Spirochaetales bacterium]|nr:hypothetical protein [Spirochaetales bacterium]
MVEVGGQAGKVSSVTGAVEEPAGAAPGTAGELGAALSVKTQAALYDGFPGGAWPDNNRIKIGAHTAFLFRPSDPLDVSVGAEAHHAIMLDGDVDYVFYLRVGPRVGLNYHLGEHLMISGVVHPFWVATTETSVADSYELTATIPTGAVAVSFFF